MRLDEAGEPVGDLFELTGDTPVAEKEEAKPASNPTAGGIAAASRQDDNGDDDDLMIVEEDAESPSKKRLKSIDAQRDDVIDLE